MLRESFIVGTLVLSFTMLGCPSQDPVRPKEEAGKSPNTTQLPSPLSSISTPTPRDAGYEGPVGMRSLKSLRRWFLRDRSTPIVLPTGKCKVLP